MILNTVTYFMNMTRNTIGIETTVVIISSACIDSGVGSIPNKGRNGIGNNMNAHNKPKAISLRHFLRKLICMNLLIR